MLFICSICCLKLLFCLSNRRQMKNRADSATDLDRPPTDTLSRKSSTKSTRSLPATPISTINEGYESVAPPGRPPKSPEVTRAPEVSGPESNYDVVPPRHPIPSNLDTSQKCPLSGSTTPQYPPPQPPTTDKPSPRQTPPYEMVNIASSSSQSPSSSPNRSQGVYQQPTSNREAIDPRFESYDNVNIKKHFGLPYLDQ